MSESTATRRQRVSTAEAERLTGVAVRTIRQWIDADRLTAVRQGRAWLVDPSEVVELREQRPNGHLRQLRHDVDNNRRSCAAVPGARGDTAPLGARGSVDALRHQTVSALESRSSTGELRPTTTAQLLTLTSTERMMPLTQASSTPCVAKSREGWACSHYGVTGCPVPLCIVHLSHIYEFINKRHVASVISAVLPDLQEVVDSARCVIPGVVYYIRVGELIKIGYTRDLDQRLRAYPPDAELLATEIGNELIEQAGHAQFGDLLAARAEWFHPGPALLAHIEALTR